jgi:cytoskeletal protein CcmA (bactofilin family)
MNVGSKTVTNVDSENKVSVSGGVETDIYGKTKVELSSDGSVEANGKVLTTIVGGTVKLNC